MGITAKVILAALLTLTSIGIVGCIPHPMIRTIRVRPEIVDVENRVLSIQMVTPSAAAAERVICRGVFTAALLEASTDSIDEFLGGYATPKELQKGDIRFVLQESGKTSVLRLAERASAPSTVYVAVQIPSDLKNAKAAWVNEGQDAMIIVPEETQSQADKIGFDYQSVLASAEQGKGNAISDLMEFSAKTDAAGGLGHGVVLLELLGKVGDSRFAAVAARQTGETKKIVAESLRVGEAYIQPPLGKPLQDAYPETWKTVAQSG